MRVRIGVISVPQLPRAPRPGSARMTRSGTGVTDSGCAAE
jgi:hypothetical protein